MVPRRQKFNSIPTPVAFVTGAASALGKAICWKLARQGFRLALHYGKSRDKILGLQRELAWENIDSFLIQADLSKPNHAAHLMSRVGRQWGRLDLVINNASIFKPTPLPKNDWSEWTRLFTVNSITPYALAAAAKPWLAKTKGSIVNIGDIYGELPILKNHAAYSASKAAVLFLTKYLAVELAPEIRVNAISPGVISFPPKYTAQRRKKLVLKSALQKQGTPEEIAEAVWFLASNQFVTGQVLKVDGGRFIS